MRWRNKSQQYLLILAALLFPAISWAAVSDVSTTSFSQTTGTTATISAVTCSGTDAVWGIVAGGAAGTHPTGITVGGNAATLIDSREEGGINQLSTWRYVAPSGSNDIVATWAASQSSGAGIVAVCFNGAHQTTPVGTPANATGNSTSATGATVSGSAGNDLVLTAVSFSASGGITISADSPATELSETNPYGGWGLAVGKTASGSSINPAWTLSGTNYWTTSAVNIAASGGGGGGAGTFGPRLRILQ
jgi:hypothetical protein